MNKNLIYFFICSMLLIVVACRLNYIARNEKETTVSSTYSNKAAYISKTAQLKVSKQNNVSNDSEKKITMISRQETYPTSIKEINVIIENNTSVEYNTSLGYTIEYFNGSAWSRVPLDFNINYLIVFLPPGESKEFSIYLYPEQYNYKPGRYRISKTVYSSSKDAQILTCEFNVK